MTPDSTLNRPIIITTYDVFINFGFCIQKLFTCHKPRVQCAHSEEEDVFLLSFYESKKSLAFHFHHQG